MFVAQDISQPGQWSHDLLNIQTIIGINSVPTIYPIIAAATATTPILTTIVNNSINLYLMSICTLVQYRQNIRI